MDFDRSLKGETVEQAQIQPPVCVAPQCSVRKAIATMQSGKVGDILVCEGERLVGIFTERDALRLMAESCDWDGPISSVMVKSPVTIRPSESLLVAVQRMVQGGYRRLPVVDERRRPLGTITVSGVVHWLVQHFPRTVYNLPPNHDSVIQEREGA